MELNPILQRIHDRMTVLGWSKADLGRAAKIPYHRLNPWFVRNTTPNGPDLAAVARALGVTTGHLVAGEPITEPSARDAILGFYDSLTGDRRRQLEEFAQFLADQQAIRDNEPDP